MQCPKCHVTLEDEDDGPYICCADAPMQWQCEKCGKVSEGFAFPYGCCPQCGGKLALRDVGTMQGVDMAALDAVRMAFEIELGGRAFYQRAAAESSDDELRALFGRFAIMEGEHMETLSRRYHIEPPHPSPGFRVELAAMHTPGHLISPVEPAPSSSLFSSCENFLECVKKHFPAPLSSEPAPPTPSTASMTSCVFFQYSNWSYPT